MGICLSVLVRSILATRYLAGVEQRPARTRQRNAKDIHPVHNVLFIHFSSPQVGASRQSSRICGLISRVLYASSLSLSLIDAPESCRMC